MPRTTPFHIHPLLPDLLQPFMLPAAIRALAPRRVLITDAGIPGIALSIGMTVPGASIVVLPDDDPAGEPFDAIILPIPAADERQADDAVAAALPLLAPGGAILLPMAAEQFERWRESAEHDGLVCRPYWLDADARGFRGMMLAMVSQRHPDAWIFVGPSFSGKSSGARELARRSDLPVAYGDLLVYDIGFGRIAASPRLTEICREGCRVWKLEWAIPELLGAGLAGDLLSLVQPFVRGESFVFDMWIPHPHLPAFRRLLEERGYMVRLIEDGAATRDR